MVPLDSSALKNFLRKHWAAVTLFVIGVLLSLSGSVYVFWWFSGNAQSTGLVPSSLGLWSMHHLVWFIIYMVLWELFIIGIPVAVAGVIGWQWWKRLPSEEWPGYPRWKGSRRSRGGGGGSFMFFIVFSVKVYLDGKWNLPIATWTLDYVVGSVILILALAAAILGIPGAIAAVWWVRREMRKP